MLAISNIAWQGHESDAVYTLMEAHGFRGLEVSPARNGGGAVSFKSACARYSIEVVAMQSLLWGLPRLRIFGDEAAREKTMGHLKKCIDLGGHLGVKALVFGSPVNRAMPDGDRGRNLELAMDFFDTLGTYARGRGARFCIEPNPGAYGTNFLCRTAEALQFVKEVGNEGLMVHLDTGALALNGERPRDILPGALPHIGHIHISEPFLEPVSGHGELHQELSRLIRDGRYAGAVSIEMAAGRGEDRLECIRKALEGVGKVYGD